MTESPLPSNTTNGDPDTPPESDEALAKWLESREEGLDTTFRRDYPVLWWSTLLGPFALTFAILAGVYLRMGGQYVGQLVSLAVVTFFALGKFVILGGSEAGLSPEEQTLLTRGELFLMVVYMDLVTALLIVFHMGFLFKIPKLGRRLVALVEDGRFILKTNPWMKRATFIGLVAFVVFPLAATGSVGGAIFGRLLGMSRLATLAGVTLGSIIGCGLMYFGAGVINHYLPNKDDPILLIGGVVVIGGLIALLNYRYRRFKELYRERKS